MAFVCDKNTIEGGDAGQFYLHLNVSFYLAYLCFVHFAFTISPKWNPQFAFLYMILAMELTSLSLVRAFREAKFVLYCQALSALIPYFFANNNTNYARWLPIHLRDMLTLE